MSRLKNKIDEQWILLALCCFVTAGGVGVSNSIGVFSSVICDDLSLSRGNYGWISTISSVVSSITLFFIPRIIAKLGIKRTVTIGVVLFSASSLVKSVSDGLILLYFSGVLSGVGGCMCSMSVLFIIVNNAFSKNNGVASSIMASFSGIAGALFSRLFALMISGLGWRTAYLLVGLLTLLLGAPLILYRRNLLPPPSESSEQRVVSVKAPGSPTLYLVLCCFFCIAFETSVVAGFYFSEYAVSLGLGTDVGAKLLSYSMIGNIVSKLINGKLTDRIGSPLSNTLLGLVAFASSLFLVKNVSPSVLELLAFFYGFLYSVSGLGATLMAKELFGSEDYLRYFSVMSFCITVVYSLGTPLMGYFYDSTGTYIPMYKLASVTLAIACGICLLLQLISSINKTKEKKP